MPKTEFIVEEFFQSQDETQRILLLQEKINQYLEGMLLRNMKD